MPLSHRRQGLHRVSAGWAVLRRWRGIAVQPQGHQLPAKGECPESAHPSHHAARRRQQRQPWPGAQHGQRCERRQWHQDHGQLHRRQRRAEGGPAGRLLGDPGRKQRVARLDRRQGQPGQQGHLRCACHVRGEIRRRFFPHRPEVRFAQPPVHRAGHFGQRGRFDLPRWPHRQHIHRRLAQCGQWQGLGDHQQWPGRCGPAAWQHPGRQRGARADHHPRP